MKHFLFLLLISGAYSLAPLKKVDNPVAGRYIVKLKDGTNVPRFINEFEKEIISTKSDFSILKKYEKVFNGFAARLSEKFLNLLLEKEVVDYIEEDALFIVSQTSSPQPWGLDRIDQIALPLDGNYDPIGSGSNANVYVMDSGIFYEHDDFEGRAQCAYDAIEGDCSRSIDCNGHGTHCAGVVGGFTYGVAKDVSIYSVRVFNCDGNGYSSDIIDACEWVCSNSVQPAVVSMSFGGGASESVDQAVSYIVSNGSVVVVSAGNEGADACSYSPARLTNVITVAATDETDKRAGFSNFGSCVDIFAPGVDIESAWIGSTNSVYTFSGTSASAPHVAGAAAILRSMNEAMTPDEVKSALLSRAINGTVNSAGDKSPNLLLYVGPGDGPNTPPSKPACSYSITTNGSSVESPNYPLNYDNDLNCDYTISTEDGYYVSLAFDDFDVEGGENCKYDVLEIYDGSTGISSNKMASLCGSNNVGIYNSTGNVMHLIFKTDSVGNRRGFSAIANFLEKPEVVLPPAIGNFCSCNGTCDFENNIIKSPNYPGNYGNDEYCVYQFSVPAGYVVNVTFLNFDLESSATCSFDKLTIYDGVDNSYEEIDTLCGSNLPDTTLTSGFDSFLEFTTDGSITNTGFQAVITSTPACTYSITTSGSAVMSPNYPSNYDNKLSCHYKIEAEEGYYVYLEFNEFDVEDDGNCQNDVLEIYDGPFTSTNKIASLCGSYKAGIYRSSGNVMHLIFKTNPTGSGRGFLATAFFMDVVPPPAKGICSCDDTCDFENNTIHSPNYPDQYENSKDCTYQFSVPHGYVVNITFEDFNLESSATCAYDKLTIYDGVDNTYDEIDTFCGQTLPNNTLTSGPDSFLEFISDESVTRSGFKAVITSALRPETLTVQCFCDDTCDLENKTISSPNYPNNYGNNQDCTYKISVPEEYVVTITFWAFDLEDSSTCSYDKLKIFDGVDDTSPEIETLCGTNLPNPVTTTGPDCFLEFTTDGSITSTGFQAVITSTLGV